jgi:hypothetical protein
MNHTAHIVISTTAGSIGAHFSRYYGQNKLPAIIPTDTEGGFVFVELPIGSDYTKLMARDDEFGPRITPGNGWNQQVAITGPGIFVLDLPDWDDDPNAYVELHIDGVIVWEASGSGENYRKNWNIITRAKNVRVTDDREIAIDLA